MALARLRQCPRTPTAQGGAAPSPRVSPPKILLQATAAAASPEPRRTSTGAEGGRPFPAGTRSHRARARMEPDSSSRRSSGPETRDPEPTGPGRSPHSPHRAPTSPGSEEILPRLPGKGPRWRGGARSWPGATGAGPRRGNGVRGKAGGEEKRHCRNPKASRPPPPPGGTVPPPLPAWDQLPSCSRRKNPSRPCSSAGTSQSARVPPPQARHSAAPHASLPGHRTSGALSPRAPVPLQPQPSRSRPPPPSARFQIEIPWLGPSQDSARQPRPARRKPLPRPRRTRPPHENPLAPRHAPRAQAPPPSRRGRPFPAGFPETGRRVPQAGRTSDPQPALDYDCECVCARRASSRIQV